LTPADAVALQLANLPQEEPESTPTAARTTGPGFLGWLIIILGALAVLAVLGYPFVKKRQGERG